MEGSIMQISDKDQERIDNIMDNFDFNQVSLVMEALNWKWGNDDSSPTQSEIRSSARQLLKDLVCEPELSGLATGGFFATRHPCGELDLKFVVDHWTTGEQI